MDGNVVLLLLIVAIVVFLLYTRNRPPKTPAAVELTRLLGIVPCMSGAQFEVFVAKIMRGLGYRATVLGGSGDQGVDVIATAGKERLAIQCKNYAKPVGNKPVQEVYAGARHHKCTAAWVVAPEGFTKGAVELARSVGVSLRDAQDLREWIRQLDLRGWIRQLDAKGRANNAREDNKKEVTLASERSGTVDLDARSTRNTEGRMTESNMEKHTLTVGSARMGEQVRFTAEVLGTTHVNGGAGRKKDLCDVMWAVKCPYPFDESKVGMVRLVLEKGRRGGLSPSVAFSVGGSENGFIFARSVGTIELEDDDGLTDSQRKALEALENLGAEGATWKQWWDASGMAKTTFTDARRELENLGLVMKQDDRYFVTGGRGPEGPTGPNSDLFGPLPR